jgi:hypothetical protein
MFWQKQTSVLGTTPDKFKHSYNGKVLTRRNVYKDSLCSEDAQVSMKKKKKKKKPVQQKLNQPTLLNISGMLLLQNFLGYMM